MSRIVSLLVGAVFLLSAMCVSAAEVVYDRILVKVNDNIITQYDLDEEMKPIMAKIKDRQLSAKEQEQLVKMRKQALEKMVNDALLAQEVTKFGITVSEEAVDLEVEGIKKQRGIDDEKFAELLKKEDMTLQVFRDKLEKTIQKQELLSYMVHSKVLVTDSEIQKEYEARRDDYVLEKMIELGIILLPADVSAVEVSKRITDGEMTFAEAVEKFSVGPGKDKGGSIGEVGWNDLAEDWKESIEGVDVGGVGTPITVQGKEALLSPIKVIEDRLVPLEEVRDDIFKRLTESKRNEIFDEYFEKLKEDSVIEYLDKSLMPANGVS